MKELFKRLDSAKVKMNKGNPIRMDLFLSFLSVNVERVEDHAGRSTGLTKLMGDQGLVINGGMVSVEDKENPHSVKKVEFLDSIEYKENPQNLHNNLVNPFMLADIMTNKGKAFFVEYYKGDIEAELVKVKAKKRVLRGKIADLDSLEDSIVILMGYKSKT